MQADTTAKEAVWLDATAQAGAIAGGEVSATELVGEYLARIEALDDRVRAYVTVDSDGALAAAREVDRRRGEGQGGLRPFEGVALSIKDVDDVAGLPTTHSCEVLAENVAHSDGPVVRRFREAGFVIIGKSNVPEFCSDMTTSKLNGTSRNPWDLALTPGGSSGGAAAALSAGMCAASHGTDGAGSTRVPASFCGLVGLKPTRGLVNFGPDEGNPFFGTSEPGILTRSVRDAAGMLDALAPIGGWTPARQRPFLDDVGVEPGDLRVAVCTTHPAGTVDPECASAAQDAAAVLETLGHRVEMAAPRWEVILAAAGMPMQVPYSAALVPLDQVDRVEPRNRAALVSSASLTVLDHYQMVETARAAAREFLSLWDSWDVLVTPTAGILPPPVEWASWDDDSTTHMTRFATFPNFAQPFNVSGQPALSLPLGWTDGGFPIGVQLAARKLEEPLLFRLASQLEQARPWTERTVAAGKALT